MTKKQFIAGAVCPSCGEMDVIRVFVDNHGHKIRECVECDYSETFSSDPELKGGLPKTRILREEKVLEADTDIVRIIPPSK